MCTAAGFVMSTSWSCTWSKSENISTRCSSMKLPGSGVHVFKLHLSKRRTFWTLQTLSMFDLSVRLPIVDSVCFGDLTKPGITIADFDRVYWNLEICLQLDRRHRCRILWKSDIVCRTWKCIHGFMFYRSPACHEELHRKIQKKVPYITSPKTLSTSS